MKFYSTKNSKLRISLREAVLHGQPADGGLYMPERIPVLPQDFFRSLPTLSFSEIGFEVAHALLGDDLSNAELHDLTEHTLTFPAPVVEVEPNLYSLELFHGPTLAFKDFGARFSRTGCSRITSSRMSHTTGSWPSTIFLAAYGKALMRQDNKGGTLDPVQPANRHRNVGQQARRILTCHREIRRLWRQRSVKRRLARKLPPSDFQSGGALWGYS